MLDENGEPYGNAAKVRTLFDKVQHPQLTSSISALKVCNNMPGKDMNYSSSSNHLSAEVSTMPETLSTKRNVSAMGQDATVDGIMKNGVIHTGYYNNCHQLSKEDKDKVISERARIGTARPGKAPKGRKVSAANTNKQKREMAEMKKDLAQAMHHIAEINSVCKDKDKDDDEKPADDAGDSFGGRN